jgi:N-acetylmuramoyl-L-alanine amidase CwlA
MAQDYSATGMPPMIGQVLTIPQWLDYVANYQFTNIKPTRLVLHHTWKPTVEQWRGLASMKGMQSFYGGKGWTSAPHLYVGPDGIWLFTPLKDIGIHANAGNGSRSAGWYSIGVEMVGNYDQARPTGAIWDATKAIIGGLSRKLGIAPKDFIFFHREYNKNKSCPGWAITKEWVIAETDAWLKNQGSAPVAIPAGVIGSPTPDVEHLGELLLNQSFARRAEGYNETWAFHQFAVDQGLGFPLAKSQMLTAEGKQINYQPFARDTLYCEVPNWGDVKRLSELLAGTIPPAGTIGRALLDATFQIGGSPYNADWAFHQYAVAPTARLGPPLGKSATVAVDGITYSYQVFASDTIYNPGNEWTNIKRLSALANSSNSSEIKLRDQLLAKTYEAAGQQYRPDWAFHQLAFKLGLGAPLGKADPVAMDGSQYNFQVYATDTLYNLVPNWNDVKRLTDLYTKKAGAVLSAGEGERLTALLSVSDGPMQYDPELKQHYIVRYSIPGTGPSAYSDRGRSKISAIILHADSGPTEATLERMYTPGAKSMPHYYVADDAQIYQLISDRYAARHAGMATWQGRRRNMNRNSIGIMIERGRRGITPKQVAALRDLVSTLRETYAVAADAVLRWSDLVPGRGGNLADLSLEAVVEAPKE